MLVLTAILIASVLVVAYVAVNRLSLVNDQIRQLVDRTIQKQIVSSDVHVKFLTSVRGQKNSILSPDDEQSVAHAKLSRDSLNEARASFGKLKQLITEDNNEQQLKAVEALGNALDGVLKINEE